VQPTDKIKSTGDVRPSGLKELSFGKQRMTTAGDLVHDGGHGAMPAVQLVFPVGESSTLEK
jgi:hypothetical protein